MWPLRDHLDRLAPAQAGALRGVVGLAESGTPDRFLAGAATLELLAAAAEELPLLCVVDDAQWLDGPSAEAITFAARRLQADPVALVLATRDGRDRVLDAAGFRALRLGGLSQEASAALLLEHAGALEAGWRNLILQIAQGNPLALLELPLALSGGHLSGGELFGTPAGELLPLTPALEDAFLARARELPAASQLLLLLAAADSTADPAVVQAAARHLAIEPADIDAVEATGLLRFTPAEVTFRHPLVRSAVYESASFSQRARVHRALADTPDPDRRAWHQAAALAGPDDAVADALEESAWRARARSGFGAAATALRRASSLTSDPGTRSRRLAGAAEAAWLAGRPEPASSLLHEASELAADAVVVADIEYTRALIEMADATPADALVRLTNAAAAVAAADPARAQKLLLQAREAAVLCADTGAEARVSRRAEELTPGGTDDPGDRFAATFLGGMARWLDGDIPGAVPRLRQALAAAETSADPRRLFWAGIAAFVLGDDDQTRRFFHADAAQARAAGSVAMVAQALTMVASSELLQGRAASARASATEGLSLAQLTGQRNIACFHLAVLARVAASFGTEEETRSRVAECYETILTRRLPLIDHMVSVALGEMELAQGRADRAFTHLSDVAARGLGPADPLMRLHAFPAYAEASARACAGPASRPRP